MRNFIFVLFLFLSCHTYGQEDKQTVFNDDFFTNKNNWSLSNTTLRQSRITEGKLIDYYGEDGLVTTNLSEVKFNKSGNYIIRFSVANLNNKKGFRYPTYSKRNNGKLKESWNENPTWGFVWGFKDWNNYNAIILQKVINNNGKTVCSYKAYSMIDGVEISTDGWQKDTDIFSDETAYYEFVIYKRENRFSIYVNKDNEEQYLVSQRGNTIWPGNFVGPYIGAGAKISLDYIKIETKTEPEYTSIIK